MIWSASYYADNISRELVPYLEQEFGAERAKEIFLESAKEAWGLSGKQILHEIAWDAFGYSLSPAANRLLLAGRGYTTCCGRNYDIMRRNTPMLTKYYVDYGCWWFGVGLAITVPGEILCLCGRRRFVRKSGSVGKFLFCLGVCVVTCGIVVVWYTMQGAGIMDYKHTIVTGSLWAAWMTVVCGKAISGSALWENGRE